MKKDLLMSPKVHKLKAHDVVPEGAAAQYRTFVEHRWHNMQKLSKLHQNSAAANTRGQAVKKRRLVSSVFGHEVELIVPGEEARDGALAVTITPGTNAATKAGKKRARGSQ